MYGSVFLSCFRICLLVGAASCYFASSSVVCAQEFWLSTTGNVNGQALQPATAVNVPAPVHGLSDVNGALPDGKLFVWGRAGSAGIQNFSLRLIADKDLISFGQAIVANPSLVTNLGATNRWEDTLNPTGSQFVDFAENSLPTVGDLMGINLGLSGQGRTAGVGMLDQSKSIDPFYDSATDGWLIAEVPYDITRTSGLATAGVVEISMAIGARGMNAPDGSVSDFSAQLGFAGAPLFNAKFDRCVESFGFLNCPAMSKSAEIQIGGVSTGLACDFVGPAGCDIQDLDALYLGTNGAPSRTNANIRNWLEDASAINNPAKQSSSHMYRIGDVNLDGLVDSTDLGFLLNQFGNSGRRWGQGNLNADNVVDSTDLGGLLNNFGFASVAATATVPEPKSTCSFVFGIFFCLQLLRQCGTRRNSRVGSVTNL